MTDRNLALEPFMKTICGEGRVRCQYSEQDDQCNVAPVQGWTDRTCTIGHRDQKQTHMGKLREMGKPDLQYPLLTVTRDSVGTGPTPGLPTSSTVRPVTWVLGPHSRQSKTCEGPQLSPHFMEQVSSPHTASQVQGSSYQSQKQRSA